ncbi:MAG: NAD(P)-binding domain-containing protein [Lachnospiraceae bacterium]|nr:NAD(P)-binding domain-containing protein [Lachnospiraceae bacterium]
MKVGIIGYGSMGKMLLWKFSKAGNIARQDLMVSNRTVEKLKEAEEIACIVTSRQLAAEADIIFVCVRPSDIKQVLEEIRDVIGKDALLVSLNGSVSFETISKLADCKTAKVIPSLTAEIERSQTLVCYNAKVNAEDKVSLTDLLKCIGNVIELPEEEMGMGSELVSCMPGFIASIFDVICTSAQGHTAIPKEQIVQMVLSTMSATGNLMLQKDMTFEDVVTRVATKGGITEEGSKVIYEGFPATADLMFEKTLEKRRITTENVEKQINNN